ncbi:hypothetical protein ABK040_000119 [Willaertia magna]
MIKLKPTIIFLIFIFLIVNLYFLLHLLSTYDKSSNKKLKQQEQPILISSENDQINEKQVEKQEAKPIIIPQQPFTEINNIKNNDNKNEVINMKLGCLMNDNEIKPTFQSNVCFKEYDCGFLNDWKQQKLIMCDNPLSTTTISNNDIITNMNDINSNLICYSTINKHIPVPTRPHTICESNQLIIDFTKLSLAQCLKYRPGYLCRTFTYYNYKNGALMGNCKVNENNFKLDKFSNDFGKDIFSSFQNNLNNLNKIKIEKGITIFLTREVDEHVNMFHATSDFFNTYLMLEFFQINNQEDVQIVILDDHKDGPFDMIWDNTFSFKKPMRRARDFKDQVILFERAIFQMAGYASPLLSHLLDFNKNNKGQCSDRLVTISLFTERIIKGFKIPIRDLNNKVIKVLFISRKPYNLNGIQHSFMGRQISNEDEIMKSLKSLEKENNFQVEKIDFAHLTFKEQIQKVYYSDFLIGFHGAGLTHALWLPNSNAAVLELWSKESVQNWQCFEQITLWKGNLYDIWKNRDDKKHWKDANGDYTEVNVNEFLEKFMNLLKELKNKRNI